MSILVTGGLGYIGSHTCVELLKNNHDVIIVDNLSNSERQTVDIIQELGGKPITFYELDVCDREKLRLIFNKHTITAVIHFAGLKSVNESIAKPLSYYSNNLISTLALCDVMNEYGVKNLIFSSSATVYGHPQTLPITEEFPLSTINPYGTSKLIIEGILKDLYRSDNSWSIVILRYFNPIGAHESGKLGEKPNGIPNNLLPYVSQVAVGKLEKLHVFGHDYDTEDGTAIRDYIHVVDLATGHLKALEKSTQAPDLRIYNLGTGKGYSVLQIVSNFEQASGQPVPYVLDSRREGDVPVCYADASKAKRELGWSAARDIHQMCIDAWRWMQYDANREKSTP
ncbi:UDP-glucose 4-epimerase GalE [Priestia megaterium]|nr:UDP-glucose 4-epimerase GalE [Priestia megaterium]